MKVKHKKYLKPQRIESSEPNLNGDVISLNTSLGYDYSNVKAVNSTTYYGDWMDNYTEVNIDRADVKVPISGSGGCESDEIQKIIEAEVALEIDKSILRALGVPEKYIAEQYG